MEAAHELLTVLAAKGPEAVFDMSEAAQRQSLDVIGRVGFAKNFGATAALGQPDSSHRMMDSLTGGGGHCILRFLYPGSGIDQPLFVICLLSTSC